MELDFRHTEDRTRNTEHGWTDGHGSRNSYSDLRAATSIIGAGMLVILLHKNLYKTNKCRVWNKWEENNQKIDKRTPMYIYW